MTRDLVDALIEEPQHPVPKGEPQSVKAIKARPSKMRPVMVKAMSFSIRDVESLLMYGALRGLCHEIHEQH